MKLKTYTGTLGLVLALLAGPWTLDLSGQTEVSLNFSTGASGSFLFDTGLLSGVLRKGGASTGIVPIFYRNDILSLASGEGLFNHYRVFTRGKRYGYGARRWPSKAELRPDGSVEVTWNATEERPFVLEANYRWTAPNALDLLTTVRAMEELEAVEVFLASYYGAGFTDSRVYASADPRGSTEAGFVRADRELGEWQAYPRDPKAAQVILDGRWDLGSSPLEWTMLPNYSLPLAIRRDTTTGITVLVMAKREDCFGIFTPYGEEKHYSNYLSLFGRDLQAGESAKAHCRFLILDQPTEAEILKEARFYFSAPCN